MQNYILRKLRRSLRLLEKNSSLNQLKTAPLGLFNQLPLEIIYRIFQFLPVDDMGLLALGSKAMRNLIEIFANTKQGLKLFAPGCVILAKTSLTCKQRDCQCLRKCVSLTYYGKFIHTVIRGWDNTEYCRVFEAIEKKSKIMKYIDLTLSSNLGSRKHLELIIRLFYRSIFIDECDNVNQKSFWLSTIIKSLQMIHQAKLFLILFAPIQNDEIQWTEMNEHVIANLDEAKHYFKELAVGVFMLYHLNNDWNDSDIITLLSEITATPSDWLPENVCTLLYLCGKDITILYLEDVINKGNFEEVASLLTSLSLVSIKCEGEHLFSMNIITSICDRIPSKRDKVTYWNAIADSFRNAIMYSYDLAEIGDEDSEQTMMKILESFTELFKHSVTYWNFDVEE
uniref:F-box domain-containing protein n=1 Tax=Strigamia maritima TaxID=126957 RepID=T1JE20_STRMM